MSKFQNQSRAIQAVVVLSGGMDSTVCAALAVREHGSDGVSALHVDYGQRTEGREREAFDRICDRLGITRQLVVQNQALSQIGGSALTDEQLEVPEAGTEIGHLIPITYVPFRNAHFLSVAVSWAEVLHAEKIYIGAVAQDSSGYPDCRPEYYRAFNEVIRTGTKDGNIEIVTPVIGLRKIEIVQLGLELAAPFDLTWSCYSREDSACGVCESCVLRLRAFEAAGAVDPISYLPQAARK
jgi:7-cyano-7-deazaguanine synthase